MIYGNAAGGFGMPKVIEITDTDGNVFVGAVTDSEVNLDATRNDVRLNKTFASSEGVQTGAKDIPQYRTTSGIQAVPANAEFKITTLSEYDQYDYTELQAMIMPYKTSMSNSVAVDRVVIHDNVYNAGSTTVLAPVVKDYDNKSISLGITNGNTPFLIRYFTYKEEIL